MASEASRTPQQTSRDVTARLLMLFMDSTSYQSSSLLLMYSMYRCVSDMANARYTSDHRNRNGSIFCARITLMDNKYMAKPRLMSVSKNWNQRITEQGDLLTD